MTLEGPISIENRERRTKNQVDVRILYDFDIRYDKSK